MAATVDLSWFVPLAKQLQFLKCHEREQMYAGGFGSGKTIAGGVRGLLASLQYPGTVGLVGRQSYRALKDTTQKVILFGDDKDPIIPPEIVRSYYAADERVVLTNGSEILFRSFQDFSIAKLRSLNLGWVYVDEATEASERIWLELVGRLRHPRGPRMAWGTTNPNGHDWVWKRFHPDAGLTEAEQKSRPLIIAPTDQNTHLPRGYVQQLRSMPSEWVKRYVDASFDTAAGQIWDEWDRNIHVVPAIDLPAEWSRVECLDHGRRNPTAYLQIAVDRDGNAWVEREYYQPGLVSQHATAIKVLRGDRRWAQIVADPSVFAKNHEGKSVAGSYRELGLQMKPGVSDVDGGLLRVSEYLKRDAGELFPDLHPMSGTTGPGGLGAPRLFVLDCCPNLIREIPQYVWRDLSPSQEEKIDQPEEPRKLHDHACDALRYGLQSLPAPAAVHDPNKQIERERRAPSQREMSAGLRDRSF